MVENHGQFCQIPAGVEQLVNTVAHPNFGLLVDVGNFLCADEDPVTAVGRGAPYAFHVHIKDFLYKSGQEDDPGEGFFSTRSGAFLRGYGSRTRHCTDQAVYPRIEKCRL